VATVAVRRGRSARAAAPLLLELDQRVALVDRLTLLAEDLRDGARVLGLSIFIDSRIATVSPSSTLSPTAHSIFHTVPVMCASTADM
jgi:hypothetical protein